MGNVSLCYSIPAPAGFLRRTDFRAERLLTRVEPVGLGAVLLMLVLVVDLLVYVLSLTV